MPTGRALVEFLSASILIILLPGPSVLFAIGRAIAYGKRAAVLTVAGNSLGALVLALMVALGVGPLVQASPQVLVAVQIAGAGYLVYLGVQAWNGRHAQVAAARAGHPVRSPLQLVREGFTVGVLNPKTAVFFATVMPRFIEPGATGVGRRIFIMGAAFVAMAFLSDGAYGVLAGQLRSAFDAHPRALGKLGAVGGVLITSLGALLGVGTVLEMLR